MLADLGDYLWTWPKLQILLWGMATTHSSCLLSGAVDMCEYCAVGAYYERTSFSLQHIRARSQPTDVSLSKF
jgi:hypothetical protein